MSLITPKDKASEIPKDWDDKNNKLVRKFIFNNFIEAFGFMAKVAILAEKANHHPEWSNCYKTVDIALTTHEAGSVITSKDIDLANQINKLI